MYIIYLCCAYLGNSFEVKIEAASNDITECPCDDKPSIGTLCFYTSATIRQCLRHCFHVIHDIGQECDTKTKVRCKTMTLQILAVAWSYQNAMVHQDQEYDTETVLRSPIHLHSRGL